MAIDIDYIKNIGSMLGKGALTTVAPAVMKGALLKLFREGHMDVPKMSGWVQENRSLWDSMGQDHQQEVKQLASKLGSTDWLNADWAIKAIKGEFPGVASLFLGWPKAKRWLDRQLEVLKTEARK